MEVKVTGQGRGVVHAAPRQGSGTQASARSGAGARPPAATAASAPATGAPALFDANGDGVIENWSIAYGGDSFANFDPPPSGSYGADATKTHDAADAARHSSDATPDSTGQARGPAHPMHSGTPAAISHARDAYQRDGGAGTTSAAAATAAPVPAPAPPTTPVTQPPEPPPLRSTGS
jgi:hypothetical protein